MVPGRTWLVRLKSNGSDRIEVILVADDFVPSEANNPQQSWGLKGNRQRRS